MARNRKIIEERTRFLIDYFRHHPCTDCGEADPVVLEFDHLDGKNFDIGAGVRNRTWEAVLEEMNKCEVVCVNCHKRRTARRGKFYRWIGNG